MSIRMETRQSTADESTSELIREALQRYWGYAQFRPMQEEAIRNLWEGRDACVVMPTGGGKSLCYQLPAALREHGTAVVISPLIALMQDQVAQLRKMGIPAAFLNSSLGDLARSEVKRKAVAGEFRLLYLSPERAVIESTMNWLKEVPVSFFAIDEAHCISEWGHDFRPEYRQLGKLREFFPERPIAAFTASATQRVRHDIVEQLHLRNPFCVVRSFRRENLRYVVKKCEKNMQGEYLLQVLRDITEGSVIVYVPTIKRVAETLAFLKESGIEALGYHGQMGFFDRKRNQEEWTSGRIRIIVGTIAFGLGIHKADVRAVIHLALPKSIEHYYQEAGRAGRDGEPAACILLWRGQDLGLLGHFASSFSDTSMREKVWEQFRSIKEYALSTGCRQLEICRHFGEIPKWEGCGQCDACAGDYPWVELSTLEKKHFNAPAARRTLNLILEGKSFGEIAQIRNVTLCTVENAVGRLVEDGSLELQSEWVDSARLEKIESAARQVGLDFLKPIKEFLPEEITYGEIRLVVGKLRRETGWERKRVA